MGSSVDVVVEREHHVSSDFSSSSLSKDYDLKSVDA
jgi:hypothetical protein